MRIGARLVRGRHPLLRRSPFSFRCSVLSAWTRSILAVVMTPISGPSSVIWIIQVVFTGRIISRRLQSVHGVNPDFGQVERWHIHLMNARVGRAETIGLDPMAEGTPPAYSGSNESTKVQSTIWRGFNERQRASPVPVSDGSQTADGFAVPCFLCRHFPSPRWTGLPS